MSGYTAQGTHVISSNLPGAIPAAYRKLGAIGFVCSESQVSVIIDNLSITFKGKNIPVAGDVKYAGDLVAATRLTQITTSQVAISNSKATAVGQTGLKWTAQISKADYEKLTTDANISKVEVGAAVVLIDNASNGIKIENAASNIAGTAPWTETTTYSREFLIALRMQEILLTVQSVILRSL